MKYVLDTNICIYLIKRRPEIVLKKFNSIRVGDIGISSITLSELMFGVQKSQHRETNRDALQEFISPLEILPFNELSAEHYGELRFYLEKKGTPIGSMDLMIAAHARSLDSILVTHNTREFQRIPGLIVEDWNS